MNEQLQLALTAILDKATSGVEVGVNFLSSEIPEVIQQLLLWKLLQAGLWATICIMLLIAAIFSIRYWGKGEKIDPKCHHSSGNYEATLTHDEDGNAHPVAIAGCMAFYLVAPVLVIGAIESIGVALQIWVAPKVYLIEYAASLAK